MEEEETRDYSSRQDPSNLHFPVSLRRRRAPRRKEKEKQRSQVPGKRPPAGTIWQLEDLLRQTENVICYAFRAGTCQQNPYPRKHICHGLRRTTWLQPVASACRAGLAPSEHSSASSTSRPRIPLVRSCRSPSQLLLVAAHDCHVTDFLDALQEWWSQQNETAYELVCFDLGRKLDFFEVLLVLEHIRDGFFKGGAPGAARQHIVQGFATSVPTSPHSDRGSIRWGFCPSPQSQAKVDKVEQRSRDGDVVFLSKQTLCVKKRIGIRLVFPERLEWTRAFRPREHPG